MPEIIREFDDYSLSFPCNPHELRSCAIGFRLLFWSDFLLVCGMLLMTATMCWFTLNSPQFQTFCEELTPEKALEIQKMPLKEQGEYFSKILPVEQLAPLVTFATLLFLGGVLINLVGTIFCMNCPPISGARTYGLLWLGVGLLTGIPGLVAFIPVFYLIAWNFWLSFLFRMAFLLGENRVPPLLRKINWLTLLVLLVLCFTASVPYMLQVLCLCLFVSVFLMYAKVLKLLRLKIHQYTQFWDHGNEDFHTKKLA